MVSTDRPYCWLAALAVCVLITGSGCGESFEAEEAPRDRINYPVGLTMHPDGEHLYVINSNFSAKYEPEVGGTVSVIDTETLQIDPGATPRIPSFGGDIELNGDASTAYVTLREGDSLAVLDVLDGEDGESGGRVACREDGEIVDRPGPCVVERVPSTSEGAPFFEDPFGLTVSTLERQHPESGDATSIDLLNISYLSSASGGGRVSTVSIPDGSLESATMQTAGLISGNRVARRPGTMNFYIAGRNSNGLLVYSPYLNLRDPASFGAVEAIVQKDGIALTRETGSADARGLAFNRDGSRLLVATRQPDAVHVVDITAEDQTTGDGVRRQVTETIPVPNGPSSIMLREMPGGDSLAYVPVYGANRILVIDPSAGTVVDSIETDASPYNIVMDTADGRCEGPGTPCRAYVTLFDDTPRRYDDCDPDTAACGSVAVLDLDPASARYHRVISKIR